MNCQPHQYAWIDMPREFATAGFEQLQNRVVLTKYLVPGQARPMWKVEPEQRVPCAVHATAGAVQIKPGDTFVVECFPDDWLRPFDADSTPPFDLADIYIGAERLDLLELVE